MKKNNSSFFIHYNNGDNIYYINVYFIYSVIGYIIEFVINLIIGYNGGILYGFWTPVYGIGSLIVIYIYDKLVYKLDNHKILKFLIIFLIGFFLLSFIEYIGGILIELIFNKTIWDYSDYKFNLGKYVALEMALIWGISALILIYFIRKPIDKIIKKIPKFITWILCVLFIIDLICTLLFK